MTNQVIPAGAVEAARAIILPYVDDEHFDLNAVSRAALEAAAPRMLAIVSTLAELEALPLESVIRDAQGHVLERWGEQDESTWATVMVASFIPPDQIALPATVLCGGIRP